MVSERCPKGLAGRQWRVCARRREVVFRVGLFMVAAGYALVIVALAQNAPLR